MQTFLAGADWPHRLRDSAALEQLHWSTNRRPDYDQLTVLAIDHRSQFDDLVRELGTDNLDRVPHFKALALAAMDQLGQGNPDFGVLLDGRYGARALEAAADTPYWIGRPIELPGSRPIRFEGAPNVATTLRDWPIDHIVKCLVFYHPDDAPELRAAQDRQIVRLFDACRATRHELLLEVIASKHGPIDATTSARLIDHVYDLGVYPDWWKLEPAADAAAWRNIERAIRARDPHCRGVVLLGLSAPQEELLASFAAAAPCGIVKGFAVGRTIWHDVAARWLTGAIGDAAAVAEMAENFGTLVEAWRAARGARAAA